MKNNPDEFSQDLDFLIRSQRPKAKAEVSEFPDLLLLQSALFQQEQEDSEQDLQATPTVLPEELYALPEEMISFSPEPAPQELKIK